MAQASSLPWDELAAMYGAKFMEGLGLLGTRRKHVNARSVQHLMGYLKRELASEDTPKAKRSKQELPAVIEGYGQGLVPLIVPMTLLAHWTKYKQKTGCEASAAFCSFVKSLKAAASEALSQEQCCTVKTMDIGPSP